MRSERDVLIERTGRALSARLRRTVGPSTELDLFDAALALPAPAEPDAARPRHGGAVLRAFAAMVRHTCPEAGPDTDREATRLRDGITEHVFAAKREWEALLDERDALRTQLDAIVRATLGDDAVARAERER